MFHNSNILCSSLLFLAGLSSAFPWSRNEVLPRATSSPATRNVIWVTGPDQGTNSTTSGTQVDLSPLISQKTQVTHVVLASAHINGPNSSVSSTPYINFWRALPINDSGTAFIFPQMQNLQENGVKVLLSLGGAADGTWGHLESNFTYYYTPLLQAIQKYGFDGLDLDIETAYSTSGALKLLNQLVSDMGSSFLLTMSPVQQCLANSGNCSFGSVNYQQLDSTGSFPNRPNSKLVSFYNAQFYSGGGSGSNSPSAYESVVSAGFAASRVVMGVADCSSDGSGWYPLTTYNSTVTALRKKYGGNFGGVFGWSWQNAGLCDNLQYPWQWVKEMGQFLYN